MPTNFLDLPAELRTHIYTYLLVCKKPIGPWDPGRELVPNILCTNKQILHEARGLLYRYNRFDLSFSQPELITLFLDKIGFVNASYLQCIRVDFPRLSNIGDDVSLQEDSFRVFEKIQTACANLKTLIICPESTNDMEYQLYALESRNICAKAFALFDAHFRAISSLQEIIAEVSEGSPSPDIRRKMEDHGWTIKVVEPLAGADYDSDSYRKYYGYSAEYDDDGYDLE